MRRFLDVLTRLIARMHRGKVFTPPKSAKVNLGSGLTVREGWVNIDASLNTLASRLPKPLMLLSYKASNAPRWYSFAEYLEILRGHTFIHHDLAYGIPLPNESASLVYSSHFVEHIGREEFERLLSESYRVLAPGGKTRIVTPGFDKLVASYQDGNTEAIIETLFGNPDEGWYSQHRYLYDFALLKRLLEEAGFHDVVQLDGDEMDKRPSRYLLYVEATR
jgi:SAM-dependent methyltransferase